MRDSLSELTQLEREALDMLLKGSDPVLGILRKQLNASHFDQRNHSGAGFFMQFSIPAGIPRIPSGRSFSFGDVIADIEGLERGAGFVVRVTKGALDYLEGYSYEENWPTEVKGFSLKYVKGSRDLAALTKTGHKRT
jgi:hypothetical protein